MAILIEKRDILIRKMVILIGKCSFDRKNGKKWTILIEDVKNTALLVRKPVKIQKKPTPSIPNFPNLHLKKHQFSAHFHQFFSILLSKIRVFFSKICVFSSKIRVFFSFFI
jgi:hypothetical protein